jgi:hypothetical protein
MDRFAFVPAKIILRGRIILRDVIWSQLEMSREKVIPLIPLVQSVIVSVSEKRRHKEIADVYATKFPDYAFLNQQLKLDQSIFRARPTFCVEIKPKQGYLRKAGQRFPKCPYCLHQYAKVSMNAFTRSTNPQVCG